ncbi:ATP-binding cassette domain-containing protein [Paenibacillus flagellatus]|uniref:Daunorubicin/doxorubicin resistance ABC transporter ATP-binding protein DrrA n=1 Tax=Paenibacillus flagellatus TaxID=2211139 RepID=A0A2V5KCU4_9BACL|nr:ATP-binding cassette domain-containing protein [Paenibacillus flagellatus]PYI57368.1 daunorubicin/doxorubicin resistance ABC transporter ATP-binding protein DrrA [Paenibacillus flagellatus]
MSYAIEARDLRKSFGGVEAAKGIRLQVEQGELFALLGPNGAGKTTTVHMLSTLLKPDGGTARVAGYDVVKEARDVRKRISVTGQFAALDDRLTGLDNLFLIGRLYGYSKKEARSLAEELIASFGLEEAGHRAVDTYSGGMRRRLDIAASVVHRPELLFLDEPTTGLDPESRMQVWETVRLLLKLGTTVVLTTQYLEEADRLADRVAVLHRGTVIAEGTPDQLKASIGSKTLSIRLTELRDGEQETIDRLLANEYQLTACPDADPLVYKIPAPEADMAVHILHKLVEHGVPVGRFSLDEPTLDEAFLALIRSGRREEDAT